MLIRIGRYAGLCEVPVRGCTAQFRKPVRQCVFADVRIIGERRGDGIANVSGCAK